MRTAIACSSGRISTALAEYCKYEQRIIITHTDPHQPTNQPANPTVALTFAACHRRRLERDRANAAAKIDKHVTRRNVQAPRQLIDKYRIRFAVDFG